MSEKINNKSLIIIISLSILCVGILFYIEQVMFMPYTVKTLIKLPLFLIIPFIIKRFILKEKMKFHLSGKHLILALIICLIVMGVIWVAFSMTRSFIDTSLIINDFKNRMQITKTMFVFAALYTIIGNSFIEEYFFRGFIFQSIQNKGFNKLSYILSSLLFALYHIGIFMTWFSLPIMLLVLFGLFAGGLIFSYFVKKTQSVLASYFIHMSADITIVLIGIYGIGLFA